MPTERELLQNTPDIVEDTYEDEQIQVLRGLDAVRKRPGRYIGTTSSRGLHHLVNEIVDNSIDEAMAGRCDTINVTLHADGSVSVQDNGRGVPSGFNAEENRPTLEVVFMVLHAGGKFGGGGYKISGGLHGVGASCVNALSEWMEVENVHDGKLYTLRMERGEITRPFACLGDAGERRGLYVRFKPDPEIFTDTTEFDYEVLLKRMREQAFLNAGVRITLCDERPGTEVEDEDGNLIPRAHDLCYEGGIRSFVEHMNRAKGEEPIHPDVIYMKAEKGDITAEVAMQYCGSYTENIVTFANNMATIDGGMHETGFKAALTKVINEYARKSGALKEKDKNFSGEDVREGLSAVVSVKLPDAQFESQTKAKLGNSEVRTIVESIVSAKLAEYLEENPAVAKLIMDKSVQAYVAREKARLARESVRKSALSSVSTLPGKLADCNEKNIEVTELYLVEGDSAGGSAKSARNSQFQAILPLRGKVLNVEKSRVDKVYANVSLTPIIQALGCGIGEDFDMGRLRYGKVIIMSDADVDGEHIQVLLLTFFFRHMKPLIEEGHVYLAMPPLYKIYKRGQKKEYYAYSEAEKDKIMEELGGGTIEAERYKGLGEMDAEQLWDTTMDPETRTLKLVTIEDASACDEIFSLLMGDKVEPRRDFIAQNAKYAEYLDI
ncbi:MAG: DNA topoisomerase (ATP-hydrolyzing) subunit B [Clostridia bacterium]|nr:DNA topoisomerase (ATP-hydrolyzing) subunit B [Clostridia bacterium]